MIVLTVISYNGAPAEGLAASFDELGGSIGRADNNQLVLPDPERTISRVHARVAFRNGSYVIVDNGSNPISVNRTPLGTAREHALEPGDQIQIGGYLLSASKVAAQAAGDPFAALFGDAAVGLAAPAPAPVAARSAMLDWHSPPPPAAPPALSPGMIPDDWNPFAQDHAPAPRPAPPPTGGGDLLAGLGGGGLAAPDSIDDLFGLGGVPAHADPLGADPRDALLVQPNTAASADPLAALSRPVRIAEESFADLGSELNTPMPLPRPVLLDAPAGAVFSWDAPSRDGRVVTLPGVHRADAAPAPALPAPAPQLARTAPAPADAVHDALLAALLDGLGAPGLHLDALTPERMLLLGQILREAVRGAVELLVARAALKREMRAEVTMIVARENNPLKFSPSVEVALQHLLGTPAPGFMAPAPAVRDAFDDLRAHQLGVMAGMKAALDGVLQRFDPQQLEGKLSRKASLSNLIPGSRKARLWELFQELFGQIQAEAQDDFDELFGRAFLKAYEAQLTRLQSQGA